MQSNHTLKVRETGTVDIDPDAGNADQRRDKDLSAEDKMTKSEREGGTRPTTHELFIGQTYDKLERPDRDHDPVLHPHLLTQGTTITADEEKRIATYVCHTGLLC